MHDDRGRSQVSALAGTRKALDEGRSGPTPADPPTSPNPVPVLLCLLRFGTPAPVQLEWWCDYSKELKDALREWNPKISWKPKDLRNSLPTFAVMQGAPSDVWEQYIGHAPRSITARHYIPRLAAVSEGEDEALDQQMELFCSHVTKPLNRAIQAKSGVNVLNNFERRGLNQRMSSKL